MNYFRSIVNPFLFLIVFGILQRFLIFITSIALFKNGFDFLSSLLIGFIFDISFLSLLFLFVFLLRLFTTQKPVNIIFFTIISLWVILNAFDLLSFHYLGMRASFNSFNLFRVSDLTNKISGSIITWTFFLFLMLFAFLIRIFRKEITPIFSDTNLKAKLYIILCFTCLSLIYLPYPVNYYTDQFSFSKESKQLGQNPYFTWLTSIANTQDDFIIDESAALSNFKKQSGYSGTTENFLTRTVNYSDSAYNSIILIVMESFGANRVGMLNGEKNLSPYFDSLCSEGILYSKCFACGPRTQYGISSIMYGFPHILGYNLFRKNKLKLPFKGLPSLLSDNGYETTFIHGGNAAYDDMRLLLNSDKSITIKDVADIKQYKFKNAWGVDDESLFAFTEMNINTEAGKNLYCILSMSNHEPFQVPEDFNDFNGKQLSSSEKTFLYSDYALGTFIKKLKRTKKFEKSLIIITGDHGEHYTEKDLETKLFHVPLLIIDHKNKGIINDNICSHADIAEYILSKTGYKGKSHFIGQGLIKNSKSQVYYRNYSDEIYKVTDTVVYRYNMVNQKLSALKCTGNMYVNNITTLSDLKLTQQISYDIKSYYTATKFIFETGLYTNR